MKNNEKVEGRFCGECGRQLRWRRGRDHWFAECPAWNSWWGLFTGYRNHDLEIGPRAEPRFNRETGQPI